LEVQYENRVFNNIEGSFVVQAVNNSPPLMEANGLSLWLQ